MRTVDYVFRPKPPTWIWPVFLAYLIAAVWVGELLGWRLAAYPGGGVALLILIFVTQNPVRLERDAGGGTHLAIGRKETLSVDFSRLAEVDFLGHGYGLRDEQGGQLFAPLDGRLRMEVREAVAGRRLELNRDTEAALLGGRQGKISPIPTLVLLGIGALMPLILVGIAVVFDGGIERERNNGVDFAALTAANALPGAVANPFVGSEPRELYLVALDTKSQRQLPRLTALLEERFGMTATQTRPLIVDAGMLDRSREQLDGWQVTSQLLAAQQSAHPGRPAIVIAVTRLDTFDARFSDDRFAFMTTGATAANQLCGGLISTARFDVWPGSEEKRLGKMAGRLLGRCIGIEEDVSIRSIRNVDRLDDRAGADEQTIAHRTGERRALPGAPSR